MDGNSYIIHKHWKIKKMPRTNRIQCPICKQKLFVSTLTKRFLILCNHNEAQHLANKLNRLIENAK